MSSPLSILLELPHGRRGFALSVFGALARSVGIVLIAEAVARAIVGHSAPALWIVLGLLGAILRGGGLWLDRRLGVSLAAESKRGLRSGILSALLRGRGRPRTNSAVTVTRGIDDLDDYFTTVVPALVATAVVPIVLLVRIVFSDLLSAVIIAACLPLIPLFMVLIGRYTAESTSRTVQALERLSDHLAELAEGLPVLIGLGRSRDHARRLRELGERYHQANLATLRVAFLSSLALELIATISVALVAVVIGLRLVNGSMDLSAGLFVLLIAPECFIPLRELGAGYHASENGREARTRAQALLREVEAGADADTGAATELGAEAEFGADADFSGGCVTYGDGTVISWTGAIDTHPGVTTISGRSGAGKSTVLAALVGGLPAAARTNVAPVAAAFVPQAPRMFASTLGAELELFGLGPEPAGRALATAGLPTDPLTSTAALSPGQQRRLAIVRVMHRLGDGADVLVLDEPTAHLDEDNAALVIDMIAEAAATHRVILASHDDRVRGLADTEIRPEKTRGVSVEGAEGSQADSNGELVGAPGESSSLSTMGVYGTSTATATSASTATPAATLTSATAETGKSARTRVLPRTDPSSESVRPRDDASQWDEPSTTDASPESRTAALRRRWAILTQSLPLFTPAMLIAALTACASGLAAIALTAVSGWLIVEASYQPPIMLLLVAIVGVRFFGLSRSVLLYVSRLRLHSAIFSALTRLRASLWEHFERVGMSDRKLLTSDSALRAMVADADDVRDLVPRTLFPPIVSAMVVLGVGITVGLLDLGSLPWFVVLAVVDLIVLPLIVIRAETRLARGVRADRNRILSLLTRALDAKDDLHINGADGRVLGLLADHEKSLEAKQAASARNFGIAQVWLQLSTTATAVIVAVTSGAPTEIAAVLALMAVALGDAFASGIDAFRQMPALAAALDSLPEPQPAAVASGAFGAVEDGVTSATGGNVPADDGAASVEGRTTSAQGSVTGENRTGTVPGIEELHLEAITVGWGDEPVLDGLDLHAERGGWTLLCGDSGTGKSTSLSVLLRFLDPWAGRYSARTERDEDIDMLTASPSDLVGRIAWCPQEAHIFRSTVRGNLALAGQGVPDDAEMISALRGAGLSEWADADGLERWVGDHGSEISGGQRQRLAVARTLLTGADVIVLDEPTAHLDDETAGRLIGDLRENLRSRTVVMVTHDRRLTTDEDTVVDLGSERPALSRAVGGVGS
ncbi:thiol reductant ABC exporter subunit CydC [Brevibacterium oceani]|uniref:thiol reductant ABC exporter subunit CydC n=1 Tax=Brevibacterium oceani TaxID=358099 RepID=UPI001B33B406|nr:thiol reductant ABC exporter subunit CydC [Brevibacterium oceani]